MAVVKANAYGHGSVPVALRALKEGADALGVARIQEGIELRQAGISAPILIFGPAVPEMVSDLLEQDLTATVADTESARKLSFEAEKAGKKIRIHLKVDTGMGRLGLVSWPGAGDMAAALEAAEEIVRLKGLEPEGVFTHFAASDTVDKTWARQQAEWFSDFLDRLRQRGIGFPLRHCCNSAGIMEMPDVHMDMVRGGISLYGLWPSDEVDKTRIILKPAMTLRSRVLQVKPVNAGFCVSYGMTWKAPRATKVATVAVGYADGYNRLLSSNAEMMVRGQRARIAGRVCMDLTMLDVGHIPGVTPGDVVTVFGGPDNGGVTADELARTLGTINYEIVSTITARVVRRYEIVSAITTRVVRRYSE